MKTLYLFVDSERSDQYLNSIVYCVLRKDVRRVVFLHIRGLTSSPRSTDGVSGRALGAVQSQLEGLAERGEYMAPIGGGIKRLLLSEIYDPKRGMAFHALYKQCRDQAVLFSNEELSYGSIRARLRDVASEGDAAYVDITAVKKRYLGDLVVASLVEGLHGLYTFDLLNMRPDFERPWIMLIHELEAQQPVAFEYTNILDTEVYRACSKLVALRSPAMKWSAAATVALLTASFFWYLRFGSENQLTRAFFAASSLAGFVSLFFVFFPPRRA
jgi:hypothetical protein